MVVCKNEDQYSFESCQPLNDSHTALCTQIERDFLRTLLGGCSTPISALATVERETLMFTGNIFSSNGEKKIQVERKAPIADASDLGKDAALEILSSGGRELVNSIQHAEG